MCPACVFLNFDIRDTPFCCCVTFTLSGKTVKMEGGVLRVQPCGAIWRIHCIYHFTPWSSETRVLVKSFRTFDWRRENILVLASVLLLRKTLSFWEKNKTKQKTWMELEDAYFASLWMSRHMQETLFQWPLVEVSTARWDSISGCRNLLPNLSVPDIPVNFRPTI